MDEILKIIHLEKTNNKIYVLKPSQYDTRKHFYDWILCALNIDNKDFLIAVLNINMLHVEIVNK